MEEKAKEKIKFLIDDNRNAIKSLHPKKALAVSPNLLARDRERSKEEISKILSIVESHYSELVPFFRDLRQHIKDITEETHICAVYLLLSHALQDWKSSFLLAKNGDIGSWVFIRLIKESIALADLFVLESRMGEKKYIDKWFSGGIIGHAACREAHEKFFKENQRNENIDIKKMASEIYQMESLVIHSSYNTILESISPFTEDFDYDGRTQYFRTSKALLYAKGTMDATNISLKLVYLFLVKDAERYKSIDNILIKYSKPNET